jgi:arabinose-5-phosphate isomerase
MLRSEEQPTNERDQAVIACALRTLEAETGGLTALSTAIANGLGRAFITVISMMRAARRRFIVSGMGKSGHIGHMIAATLSSTGTPAFFVHPAEASHGDLGMITSDDVIIAMSWSGETAELKNLIDY